MDRTRTIIRSLLTEVGPAKYRILDPQRYRQLKRADGEDSTDNIHSEGTEAALEANWIRIAEQGFMIPGTDESFLRRLRKYLWDSYPQFADSNTTVDVEVKADKWLWGTIPVKELYDSGVSMKDLILRLRK
jgi:hypothetical protein